MIIDFFKNFWAYLLRPMLYRYRRQLFGVLLGIGMIVSVGTSYHLFRLPFVAVGGMEAMSENTTALVLETTHYQRTLNQLEQAAYYQDLKSISLLSKWERGLKLMDSLFHATNSYANLLHQATITSGAQITSNETADWLYALESYEIDFEITKFIEELAPQHTLKTLYRGYPIYNLSLGNGQEISMSIFRNLILISPITILVESGIEQLDNISSSVAESPSFTKIEQDIKDNDKTRNLVVYLNLETISSLTSVLTKSNPRAIVGLMSVGAWMGLDTQFLKEGFLLSGHLHPAKENKFLQALAQQEAPKNSRIAEYLPQNMGAMLYLGWNDFKTFYNSYKEGEDKDFEKYFMPWIGQEVTLFIEDPTDDENAFVKDKLVFIQSTDTALTWRLLNRYAHQFGELNRAAYQNFMVTQIAANSPLKALFGEDLAPLQNPYYTIIDNYIVFANARTTLEGWIKSFNTRQMILDLPEYHAFFAQAKNKSNIYALLNTPNAAKFLQYLVRPQLHDYLNTAFQKFRNIYPIGVQLYGFENHFLVNLSTAYNVFKEQEEVKATSAWQADLDATAAIAPKALRSHDGNYYILAQDVNNRLYFFNKNGENLWGKDKVLTRKINSDIFEIDFYSNNQIQYAFSTDSAIYVMDKAGSYLKIIPLISRASNGVLAVDYGKGPRFFIACRNGAFYAYEQNGKPLSGWQPLERVGRVYYPMEYMNYQNKRYFIMATKAGNCKAFKRNGEPYFKGGKLPGNMTGWGVDAPIGRIAAGNGNGKIRILNTKGKGFGLSPVKGVNKNVQFVYADVLGDKRKDYIRIGEDKMAVHYYTKEEDKKGRLKDVLKEAGVYPLGAKAKRKAFAVNLLGTTKQYIGLWEPENASISLVNAKGEVQNGFPLAGTSEFQIVDLFGERGNTLVVANNNRVYTYKLKF